MSVEGLPARVPHSWRAESPSRPVSKGAGSSCHDITPVQSHEKRTLEDRRLLVHFRETGDAAAREELVKRFLPLARQLARRYQRTNEPLDDLMQVASVGLVKAIDRFDPERGTAFSTFAVPTILGELKRYFRDAGWAAHVPRGMQERAMQLEQAVDVLHRKLGRSPSTKRARGGARSERGGGARGAGGAERVRRRLARAAALATTRRAGTATPTRSRPKRSSYDLVEYEATIEPALEGTARSAIA